MHDQSAPRPPASTSAASAASPTPRTATSSTCSARSPHRLDGLHVVLDCANGAAAGVSPEVFTDAGAKVTVIGNDPDGMNINDGVGLDPPRQPRRGRARSTAPTSASPTTATPTAASRSTPTGNVIDGDQIMAILALSMQRARRCYATTRSSPR